jgi:hypothetical protein
MRHVKDLLRAATTHVQIQHFAAGVPPLCILP